MNLSRPAIRVSFVSLLVLLAFSGRAQSSSLFFNTNFQAINSESFKTFAAEYNAFMSSDLTEDLKPKPMGIGWGMGWNVASEEGLLFGIEYNKVRSKTTATFNDGAFREFKLSDGGFRFIFGYTPMDMDDNFYLYPFLGATLGKNRLVSEYTPGSNNFTGEMLTGNYSEGSLKFNLGARAAVGSEKLKLLLGLEYIANVITTNLVDEEKRTANPFTSSVGTDYDVFANSPELYLGNYVDTDFKGVRFSVGLAFNFGM